MRISDWSSDVCSSDLVEINTVDANNNGVRDGAMVWVHSPEGAKVKVMALVTERVGRGVAFMPFHLGGHWQGEDLRHKYPAGRSEERRVGKECVHTRRYGWERDH